MTDAEKRLVDAVVAQATGRISADCVTHYGVEETTKAVVLERLGSYLREAMTNFIKAAIALPRHDCTPKEFEDMIDEGENRLQVQRTGSNVLWRYEYRGETRDHIHVDNKNKMSDEDAPLVIEYVARRDELLREEKSHDVTPRAHDILFEDVCKELGRQPYDWLEDPG